MERELIGVHSRPGFVSRSKASPNPSLAICSLLGPINMDQIKARNAISEPQATTGNYFEVARQDDQDVETPHSGSIVPVPEDGQATKPTRSERMRAAVERSRSEYKAQHVYTEPLVSSA